MKDTIEFGSDAGSFEKASMTKSKYSEDTHIEGQAELNKFGDLF
jgi:hypothetical protein